jgi:1-acyl-sn-glycerol-3-phosphate acyltransferase
MTDHKFMYSLGRALILAYTRLMLRMDIEAQGDLPAGAKLFVANHPSATDPFLIHLVSKEKLSVMITAKAFQVPVFGSFLRRVGEIPVPLEQGSAALEHAEEYLRDGRSVAIFIEGHISPEEGGFLPPRTGAARLALNSQVPVVPVGISLRRDRCLTIRSRIAGKHSEARWYLRGPYMITVGQPIQFDGDVEDRQHVRNVSEAIMHQIRLLTHESEHHTLFPKLAAAPI